MTVATAVRVAEVSAEQDGDDLVELPLHLTGAEGTVAIQLRTTLRRVGLGSAVARRTEVIDAVRRLPEFPGLMRSVAGGTFILGGPCWLGLGAVGFPPAPQRMRLDWMIEAWRSWCEAALGPLGLRVAMGRVDDAWCPGFSDVSVDGRKLMGLGFRVTRDWIAMLGVMPVRPIDAADHVLLAACHRLIGTEVRAVASTSLVECTGDPRWTVDRALRYLRAIEVGHGPPARALDERRPAPIADINSSREP